MNNRTWYNIRNINNNAVDVYVFDVIGDDVLPKDFINELEQIPDGVKINLYLSSPGGNVFDGKAIYAYLKSRRNTECHIIGLCASIATYISLACDRVTITEDSSYMIHNPSGMAMGGAEDMRKTADVLDMQKENIINAYVDKTKLPKEQIIKMMNETTWMTARIARDYGFVDEVVNKLEMVAMDVTQTEIKQEWENLMENKESKLSAIFKKIQDIALGNDEVIEEVVDETVEEIVASITKEDVENLIDEKLKAFDEKLKDVTDGLNEVKETFTNSEKSSTEKLESISNLINEVKEISLSSNTPKPDETEESDNKQYKIV